MSEREQARLYSKLRAGVVTRSDIERAGGRWSAKRFVGPVAMALRELQKFDEVTEYEGTTILTRVYIIRAQDALGEELELTCSGVASSWDPAGVVTGYDHDGETCPIHEWLVEADQKEVASAPVERDGLIPPYDVQPDPEPREDS